MRNKANFRKAKMNLTLYSTIAYEKKCLCPDPEKQTQSNPIFLFLGGLLCDVQQDADSDG